MSVTPGTTYRLVGVDTIMALGEQYDDPSNRFKFSGVFVTKNESLTYTGVTVSSPFGTLYKFEATEAGWTVGEYISEYVVRHRTIFLGEAQFGNLAEKR